MTALKVETWIWYGVVVLVAICRFASRSFALGSARNLQIDDAVMLMGICFYTTLIVTINIVAMSETNLLPPGFDVSSLTPSQMSARTYGSKLVLVVEQCQIVTIWACKACILIMYSRLTLGRREHIAIKALAVYVAFGFILMEILYFGVWCRPFHEYWAVPTSNDQCSAATDHLITNAVLNLSSDVILLCIALPMFVRSRMPLKKKFALCGIFGLGVFVILCAILNKYYSFTRPFGSDWTYWYVRESSTSLLVANLPFLWTLLRRVFKLGSLDDATRAQSVVNNLRRKHDESGESPELGGKQNPSSTASHSSRGSPQGTLAGHVRPNTSEQQDMTFITMPTWIPAAPSEPGQEAHSLGTVGETDPTSTRKPISPGPTVEDEDDYAQVLRSLKE